MKFNLPAKPRFKFTAISLTIGIFLIIYAGLGIFYLQKEGERRDLKGKIATYRILLQKLTSSIQSDAELQDEYTQLQQQLAKGENGQLQAELQRWASFPLPEQSIEIYTALLDLAQKNKVIITSMNAINPTIRETGGISYAILPFNLSIKGDCIDILNFIDNLRDDSKFTQSTRIENTSISLGKTIEQPDANDTVNIQISIMTRPIPSDPNT